LAGLDFEVHDNFSELETEKFRECFHYFDRLGDHTMKSEDVGLAMRAMGAFVTNDNITHLIKKYDPDRTGRIAEMDFMRMMAEVKDAPDNLDMCREAFSQFDKAGTGILSSGELSFILRRVGDTLNDEEMQNFIKLVDTGEGQIPMSDLLNLFER